MSVFTQPYRISNSVPFEDQAENLDTMLEDLYKQLSGRFAITFTKGSVVFSGQAGVLAEDNINLFWDDANNRLGIGTSAPSVALDVAGAIKSTTTLTLGGLTPGSVLFAGTAGLVSQDNTKLFWDDTNDFLGIGTTTPKNRIDVVGGGVRVQGTIAGATTGAGIEIQFTAAPAGVILAFDRAAGAYRNLSFSGSEIDITAVAGLKIALSGNVAIGASFTPSWILHSKILDNSTSRWLQETTGAGQVSLQLTRSGGTTADWLVYIPSGSKNWHFYDTLNIGDSIIFQSGGLLSFQGVSASEPALKRSAAELQVRLANDSAYAVLHSLAIKTEEAAVFHRTGIALTNGAGAGAGTITNAPAAGNPTKWVGIDDNGTTRYIPAW